ncbi:MAG: LacI family DNA-binding transcriptional regulator [Chloroflexota bacterium]
MSRKPSISDVAKRAAVSRTTVSYVLNNVTDIHISEPTRQRVLDAARELNYHPNAIARSLARNKTLTLALVLCVSPDRLSADAFLPGVIYGITSVTAPAGFRLLIEVVEDVTQPDAYIRLIGEAHVDGMILAGVRLDDTQILELRPNNFPIVLWGQLPGSDLPSVDVDNVNAARMAVEHLIALGHDRIACVTNAPLQHPESASRLKGYQSAIQAHGLPYDEALIRYGDYEERSGFEAMYSLLTAPNPPTAAFVASDVVALGALRAAASTRRRVPQDLALVGFDDIQFSQYLLPPLTTVRVPAREIGATAARMLLGIVQNGADSAPLPASVLLETELVIRESSGAQLTPLSR